MVREAVIQMLETFVENLARIWPFRNAGIEKEVLRPAPGQGQRLLTQEGLVWCVSTGNVWSHSSKGEPSVIGAGNTGARYAGPKASAEAQCGGLNPFRRDQESASMQKPC